MTDTELKLMAATAIVLKSAVAPKRFSAQNETFQSGYGRQRPLDGELTCTRWY